MPDGVNVGLNLISGSNISYAILRTLSNEDQATVISATFDTRYHGKAASSIRTPVHKFDESR